MIGLGFHSIQLTGALTLIALSGPVQAQSQLQRVADDAALAAVQVLSEGGGAHEATVIAQQTISSVSGVEGDVKAVPEEKTVLVKVSQPSGKTAAVSTARYIPPEQPANWPWAARQRFVVKGSPVVVGCTQDCDPDR